MSDFVLTLLVIHFMVACCWAYVYAVGVAQQLLDGDNREPPEEPRKTAWRMSLAATMACSSLLWEVQALAWVAVAVHYLLWERRQQ